MTVKTDRKDVRGIAQLLRMVFPRGGISPMMRPQFAVLFGERFHQGHDGLMTNRLAPHGHSRLLQ